MKGFFEDYLDRANAAKTAQALFDVYIGAVAGHGLDRVTFGLISDHGDAGHGIHVMHNFPSDWMSHYIANSLGRIDPVPIYGFSQTECFRWDEIPKGMRLTRAQQDCLDNGRESGLYNGVCVPLHGPHGLLAGLGLAASEKRDSFDGRIDLITAYSNHFYLAFRRLSKLADPVAQNIMLSPRERDVLTWAARGKTDSEIGALMTLSDHTVDWHMRNIFRKLGTNSRIVAAVTAQQRGLIAL